MKIVITLTNDVNEHRADIISEEITDKYAAEIEIAEVFT